MKPHRANPRDLNEDPLLRLAEQLGGHWREGPPLDGWIFHRGRWMPVEIKRPEREGLAHEFTPAQKRFVSWCQQWRAPWWVWRSEADVLRDLNTKVAR